MASKKQPKWPLKKNEILVRKRTPNDTQKYLQKAHSKRTPKKHQKFSPIQDLKKNFLCQGTGSADVARLTEQQRVRRKARADSIWHPKMALKKRL